MDYGFFLRKVIASETDWADVCEFDILLSAYNLSDRVRHVYNHVLAKEKLWLIHKEYELTPDDLPPEQYFAPDSPDESSFCLTLFEELRKRSPDLTKLSICIDSTGMLRPHLLFLLRLMERSKIMHFSVIYAEPANYKNKENTKFSAGVGYDVRPVQGYEGTPATDSSADLLIIGMGYDDRMIAEVAEDRAKADKHQLFGLPSLSADMYQQSVLRSRRAAEELSDPNFAEANRSFSPANDPFGTAAVLSEIVDQRRKERGVTNLYLSPLGTKPQVIGFGLFHIFECKDGAASITYPFSKGYSPETGKGVARVWIYTIEFDVFELS
ncbi:MAG: hypothetical protein RH945_06610 [Hyphomonas sp.]